MKHPLAVLACLLSGLAILAACSDDSTPSSPYAADFEAARQRATTEQVREILTDDQVTQAEYEEVLQWKAACLLGAGALVARVEGDGLVVQWPDPVNDDLGHVITWGRKCSEETGDVELLYGAMKSNPDKEDVNALTVACLQSFGFVGADFTVEELESALLSDQVPWDPEYGKVRGCLADPRGQMAAISDGSLSLPSQTP
ncbi:MAG: hypothetical protein LBI84_10995 [Propionibacteriaceae bacterium]|jgi:hypothetical protein|nr:hypothetical protein [Propionibacteriaceae bacterium]